MRILLACLMCELLVASQCLAIDGGPVYGGGSISVTGTYAGVLLPRPVPPGIENSLGIFTTAVPRTGLATGTFNIFRGGKFYPGTISGTADPDSAKFTGLANAQFSLTFVVGINSNGDPIEEQVLFNAIGSIKARIVPNTNISSSASARMRGDAEITFETVPAGFDPSANSGAPVSYRVRGFKQSESSG
jgi:hypothetical protein